MAPEKLYPAKLTPKELCLIEPLTVGFHAAARGRVTAEDTVAVIDELIAEAAREFSTEYTIKLVQATGTHTQRGLNIP